MDAAITTLAGSLGGVALGAGAQMMQARRSRRWQTEDRQEAQDAQRASLLWQDRRAVYSAFMEAMHDVSTHVNWAWLTSSALPKDRATGAKLLFEAANEAMSRVPEAVRVVTKRAQEVKLISGNEAVRATVDQFLSAMGEFNPSAAYQENEKRSQMGRELLGKLVLAYYAFAVAARADLGISD